MDNKKVYIVAQNQQECYTFVFDHHVKHTEHILHFYVEAYATLTVHILIMHSNMRIKIECILGGKGAHATINGAYIISGIHSVIIETFQHHKAPYTSSTLIMKGALSDQAQANYNGTICIEKDAVQSNASQENKNILLHEGARVVSIPNLEVLNNEVKCFHASAIGRFDVDQLFYAAARGIEIKKAEQLLLEAFFADVLNEKTKIECLAHLHSSS